MNRMVLILLVVAGGIAGCFSEESGYVGVGYAAPSYAYVAPGVQVVADYDYPVFYSDNYYWRYDGGVWYRSGMYNGGWAVAYDVPVGVRRIDRPNAYAHYHGNAGWGRGQEVRDHRTYQPAPTYRAAPVNRAPARGPVVRDHRR